MLSNLNPTLNNMGMSSPNWVRSEEMMEQHWAHKLERKPQFPFQTESVAVRMCRCHRLKPPNRPEIMVFCDNEFGFTLKQGHFVEY